MKHLTRIGAAVLVAAAISLIALLMGASRNSAFFEKYYQLLFALNAVVVLLLAAALAFLIAKLVQRWRTGVFGVRMTVRFALAFAAVGVLPGLIIYGMSLRFIDSSVDSWFDIRVERALDSGIELGRSILEQNKQELLQQARSLASDISTLSEDLQVFELERLREQHKVSEALLLSPRGQLIASTAQNLNSSLPKLPTPRQIQTARARGSLIEVTEQGDSESLLISVLVPVPRPERASSLALNWKRTLTPPTKLGSRRPDASSAALDNALGLHPMLQVRGTLSPSVSSNVATVTSGFHEYQALVLSHSGLRTLYRTTLTLTFLLAALGALLAAIGFASSMAAPVLQLAAGTRKVGLGRYEPIREYAGGDEVNDLTRSFNDMIRQLGDASAKLKRRTEEVENARGFLELVLGSLSTGVIVIDPDLNIVKINVGALHILGMDDLPEGSLPQILPEFAHATEGLLASAASSTDVQEAQIELSEAQGQKTLYVRASRLPLSQTQFGSLLVFDDITQMVAAQRATAWGEVARRLAHEIKNPLTPIRLAAERLDLKLGSSLPEKEAEFVHRTAGTIVNQVTAMKKMVDDFRDYARASTEQPVAIDINALALEVATLYQQGGTDIALQFEPGLPAVLGDPTRLRQVIHNIIGNAVEATDGMRPEIRLATRGIRGSDGQTAHILLTIEDNGPGFPANILKKAFEPYVTTKPLGTGLGLPTVKKIVEEHGGSVYLENKDGPDGTGARVTVQLNRLALQRG